MKNPGPRTVAARGHRGLNPRLFMTSSAAPRRGTEFRPPKILTAAARITKLGHAEALNPAEAPYFDPAPTSASALDAPAASTRRLGASAWPSSVNLGFWPGSLACFHGPFRARFPSAPANVLLGVFPALSLPLLAAQCPCWLVLIRPSHRANDVTPTRCTDDREPPPTS